jgi:hypothetical protein
MLFNERRKDEMRTMFSIVGIGFLIFFGICQSVEAGTAKFPVEVSIDASANYLIDTEIFVINLKSTPVNISFGYYNNEGLKGSCPIPASFTIQGNDTWTFPVGGCFAVAIPMTPFHLVGIGEITAPARSVSVYWRIYDVSRDNDLLMDHGKESP